MGVIGGIDGIDKSAIQVDNTAQLVAMSVQSQDMKDNTNQTITQNFTTPQEFRKAVRNGHYKGPTNGVCPGYMQCNLVVLEEDNAFDFLLFCQRNKQACPLIEVCNVDNSYSVNGSIAKDAADLRTDIPKYCIYRNGKLDREVDDVTPYWPGKCIFVLDL